MKAVFQENAQKERLMLKMKGPIEIASRGQVLLPEGSSIFLRKVARSGHISYDGRPYFISKTLAGQYIHLVVIEDRLIVDATIPLHKEYRHLV